MIDWQKRKNYFREKLIVLQSFMKNIIITRENCGERIDKFIVHEFFSHTRGYIIRNIKNGTILLNGKLTKPSHILKENDIIEIGTNFKRERLLPNPEVLLDIIYQDPNIIVINKQAGIQVHPSATEKEFTLANGLLAKFPEIKNVHDDSPGAEFRPGIVHRLDKETSGVMVVARNPETFATLKIIFQNRKAEKKYIALVQGKMKEKKGLIVKPIARASTYKKQIIATSKTKTKIRPAVTKYKVIATYGNYSLLEVFPKTGRMHQIRIHLAAIGHPVVGDKIYCPRHLKQSALKTDRHFLHAQQIVFRLFGQKFSFSAPLPEDFSRFLENID
jgi:23S rRNA pseudouridine1911/1915/1917 synthase